MRKNLVYVTILSLTVFGQSLKAMNDWWAGMSYATKVTYMPVISKGIDPAHPHTVNMPDFPEQEMRAAASGFVILIFKIKTDGVVSDLKIEAGNGEDFRESARNAVVKWKFFPAKTKDNGEEIESMMRARIDFIAQEVAESSP